MTDQLIILSENLTFGSVAGLVIIAACIIAFAGAVVQLRYDLKYR
jgi:hypothetical protein